MTSENGSAKHHLDTTTLRGDIRDAVLAEFKHLPKPWQQMNEEEQQRVITRAEDIAGELVRNAVDLVAARGLPSLAITVGKFTCEATELKGTFQAYPTDAHLLMVRNLCDRRAIFVLADPEQFMDEKAPAEPENVGTLAIPTMGPGAPSDPDALETVGRGPNAKPKRERKPPAAELPTTDTSNPPFAN